jgi:hypothetical protein
MFVSRINDLIRIRDGTQIVRPRPTAAAVASLSAAVLTEIYLCDSVLVQKYGDATAAAQRTHHPGLRVHHRCLERAAVGSADRVCVVRVSRPVRRGAWSADVFTALYARRSQSVLSISTEIYLCHTCPCHEMLRMDTPGQGGVVAGATVVPDSALASATGDDPRR